MIFRYIRSKFTPRRSDDAHRPIPRILIEGQGEAAVINPDAGKLFWYGGIAGQRPGKRPAGPFWIGNPDEAALINVESGKVHAYIWHDGCGKYHPTVHVSLLQAFRVSRDCLGSLVSLLSLPRCEIELYRVRSMVDAKNIVQYALDGQH